MDLLQAAVLALALSGNPGGETVFLDFYIDGCAPCRQMDPAVQQLAAMGYPVKKVNGGHDRALAARFGVDRYPTFLMVVNGQVVDRQIGPASLQRLEQMCKAGLAGGPQPESPPAQKYVLPIGPSPGPGLRDRGLPSDFHSTPPQDRELDARLIGATVRLRIRDASGHSCGSGTIIDARGGDALILTCGHIFRDSQGRGPIEVDLFGPAPAQKVPGRLIAFDDQRDVGLVSIQAPGPVVTARVAAPGCRVTVGDRVINLGCNNGQDPTARHARVTALDKYLGPPNLEVGGLPVEGRSGGGLFNQDGQLIGVCNAADPAEN